MWKMVTGAWARSGVRQSDQSAAGRHATRGTTGRVGVGEPPASRAPWPGGLLRPRGLLGAADVRQLHLRVGVQLQQDAGHVGAAAPFRQGGGLLQVPYIASVSPRHEVNVENNNMNDGWNKMIKII